MLDAADALVMEVRAFDVHGVGHVDVTVAFRDRSVATARLGAESVPDDLAVGQRVVVRRVANMIVAIERAPDPD